MSIEALEWARRQLVGDAHAKSLLRAVADYAGEDGTCFPSLGRLAHDCEFSEDTVRRKLRALEDGGLLVRVKMWMDEHGHRNTEGRGRETSHQIRLLLHRPSGGPGYGGSAGEPPPSDGGEGLQAARVAAGEGGAPARGGVAVVRPLVEPSLNDQEESPPNPPPGGVTAASDDGEDKTWPGADTWPEFEQAWQEPILRQSMARTVWSGLTDDERKLATRAAAGYVAYRRAQKKPPNVINAHTFLRERDAWAGFAKQAPPESRTGAKLVLSAGSTAWRGLCVVKRIWGTPEPDGDVVEDPDVIAGLESLSALYDLPADQWIEITSDRTRQAQAWRERLAKCKRAMPPAKKLRSKGERTLPGVGEGQTLTIPEWVIGWVLPSEWPPRMDGTLSTTGPPAPTMTAEDEEVVANGFC